MKNHGSVLSSCFTLKFQYFGLTLNIVKEKNEIGNNDIMFTVPSFLFCRVRNPNLLSSKYTVTDLTPAL